MFAIFNFCTVSFGGNKLTNKLNRKMVYLTAKGVGSQITQLINCALCSASNVDGTSSNLFIN